MKKNIIATLIALAVTACSPADNHEKTQTIAEKPAAVQASQVQAAPFEVDTSKIEQFDEKVDTRTITMMFKKIGADKWDKKEQEWNRRLAEAKTDADVQKIFAEQFEQFDKAAKALAQIEMKSEKGKQMHALLTSGFTGMAEATGALRHFKSSSPEDQVKLEALGPKIQQHAREVMQGMQLYMDLMKEVGVKLSPEDEAKIAEKMKEANQKIDALSQ